MLTPKLLHRLPQIAMILGLIALLLPALPASAFYPDLEANTGIILNQGTSLPITKTVLRVGMIDIAPDAIRYQLINPPVNGRLLLNDVPLTSNAIFTQDDIDHGRLFYAHNGSNTFRDSFSYRAANNLRQPMIRVSVATDASQGNDISAGPSLSADGRSVAFISAASNLVSDDTNKAFDAFVYDRQIGQIARVSVATDGSQANAFSAAPVLSANGRFVAFESAASNLVFDDTNGASDIFIYDRETRQTTRISIASDGGQANSDSSFPSLSADGRFVAFISRASNLVRGDSNNTWDAFVHDRQTGQTTRVSVASDGSQADLRSSVVTISQDGRLVAFDTRASLVSSDTNGHEDVFIHDRQTGQTTRVSVAADGSQGDGASGGPVLSANGRFVAFFSRASNLVHGDTNGVGDIFVYDRQIQQLMRVSITTDGYEANGESLAPALSADGSFVTFFSHAKNLISDDTNGSADVFLHDRQTKQTTRISIAPNGSEGNSGSYSPALSADGRFIAFDSVASNFISGDSNEKSDVFVADLGIARSFPITIIPVGGPATLYLPMLWR